MKFGACKRGGASPPKETEDELTPTEGNCFMELIAGEAGLTQAVSRQGAKVYEPGEICVGGRITTGTDLLCNATFKQLKSVRQLRSAQNPAGIEPKSARVKEAKVLASKATQRSLLQWKVGGWFSLENHHPPQDDTLLSSFSWPKLACSTLHINLPVVAQCGNFCIAPRVSKSPNALINLFLGHDSGQTPCL